MPTIPEEAKAIVAEIAKHRKDTDGKIGNIEKAVSDLQSATRLIQESTFRTETAVQGKESELKSFVRDDGSIRWKTEKKMVQTSQGRQPVEIKGLLDTEVDHGNWHGELKSLYEQRSFARMLMRDRFTPKTDLAIERHLGKAPQGIKSIVEKAMYDGAGLGAELVPDQFMAELYQTYQTPRVLRSLFSEIPMQNNTLLVPRLDRGGRPYLKGTVTSDNPAKYTASSIATSQKTVTLSGLACRFVIDDALVEDSAIALIPALQRQIAQDLADALEDCLINGDSAATHQDAIATWNIRSRWGASGLGGSSDHRRAFTGLRAAAFDKSSTLNINTLTLALILQLASEMGELAASDRVLIASPEAVYKHILDLAEVQTLDKFGPQATVLTGQIGSIAGMPIVMSRFMSSDLHTDGKYTGSGSTTGMICVSRDAWNIFSKRGIVVEQDKEITAGAINLVATERISFDSMDADATKNVAYGFNL
jgi:HK97 family phage major capsid protein